MRRTCRGEPFPANAITEVVQAILRAVLSGPMGFAEWRYCNPVGLEQLRGMSPAQVDTWRNSTPLPHAQGVRTDEGSADELAFFWATKIGGPSHGFDYAGQCILPLLANARTKVILASHPAWPSYPPGRAYLRLLWTEPSSAKHSEARLWLEAINIDFDAFATVDRFSIGRAILEHAITKADRLLIPLSVEETWAVEMQVLANASEPHVCIERVQERLQLRPSNGVCEASDQLSNKHDWVQLGVETTAPLPRLLYRPVPSQSPAVQSCCHGGSWMVLHMLPHHRLTRR
eukprot:5074167-Amphidinium_carterae.1